MSDDKHTSNEPTAPQPPSSDELPEDAATLRQRLEALDRQLHEETRRWLKADRDLRKTYHESSLAQEQAQQDIIGQLRARRRILLDALLTAEGPHVED